MGVLYDALESISPVRDAEVLEGYRRYESVLQTILTPTQVESYAAYLRESGVVRIFEEMNPGELAQLPAAIATIAADILGDINISMENRRVVALLSQYGDEKATPDFHDTPLVSR